MLPPAAAAERQHTPKPVAEQASFGAAPPTRHHTLPCPPGAAQPLPWLSRGRPPGQHPSRAAAPPQNRTAPNGACQPAFRQLGQRSRCRGRAEVGRPDSTRGLLRHPDAAPRTRRVHTSPPPGGCTVAAATAASADTAVTPAPSSRQGLPSSDVPSQPPGAAAWPLGTSAGATQLTPDAAARRQPASRGSPKAAAPGPELPPTRTHPRLPPGPCVGLGTAATAPAPPPLSPPSCTAAALAPSVLLSRCCTSSLLLLLARAQGA